MKKYPLYDLPVHAVSHTQDLLQIPSEQLSETHVLIKAHFIPFVLCNGHWVALNDIIFQDMCPS